jgi:thioredoxin-dependent peroxiredoxin
MIDPLKATKGRRMSKKTRKKSSKPRAGEAARGRAAKPAKTPASKARPATASKAKRQPGKATASIALKMPSKSLKPSLAGAAKAPAPAKKSSGGTAARPMAQPTLAEGSRAPAFRLPRDGGGIISLDDFSGRNLVLFFYPRADTPGCTREAIDFTRLAKAFAERQTAILGVSADPPKAQEAFRDKHQLVTPLGSDEQHEMLAAYGAWGEKSMYGRTFQGVLRTTVLIGADGRVIRVWRNVRVDGHADEVLAAVRAL